MTVNIKSSAASRATGTRARRQSAKSANEMGPVDAPVKGQASGGNELVPPDRWMSGMAPGDDESPPRDEVPGYAPEFSDELMRDMTAQRTGAIRVELMHNPRIALVTLVHRMAETVFGVYGAGDDVVKVSVRVTFDFALTKEHGGQGLSPAARLLVEAVTQWSDRLPGTSQALWHWLLSQPESVLLELLAYCTACSVNAVRRHPRGFDQSDALVEALNVDMADWWGAQEGVT